MKKFGFTCLVFVLFTGIVGCGGSSDSSRNTAAENPLGLESQAGYYEIEEIAFSLQKPGAETLRRTSSRARVFYSYHPADNAAEDDLKRPLFVFLNGGPGCATTTNLFSMNTAPFTLDRERVPNDGSTYAENPYRWTRMGNLLYIDAPNTGFSYNLMRRPDSRWDRLFEFGMKNFNPFIDAAQVARVLLRFLEDHPGIRGNEVILVGESYSGTRVTTLLNLLLFHSKYGDGDRIFRDETLVREIERHFRAINGAGARVTPETVARQFGRQILVEPQLTGPYQDSVTAEMFFDRDSVIARIAAETGREWNRFCFSIEHPYYTPLQCVTNWFIPEKCQRDPYIYTKPNTWGDDLEAFAMQSLLDVDALSAVLGVDVEKIGWLRPQARKKAYRYHPASILRSDGTFEIDPGYEGDLSEEEIALFQSRLDSVNRVEETLDRSAGGGLAEVFGPLEDWDEYLVGTNPGIYVAFMINEGTIGSYGELNPDKSPLFGEMFLHNLALVKTFLTDAELDLIIYSPALPESFRKYEKIVRDVQVSREKDGLPGAGHVTIFYHPDSLVDVDTPESETIHYPYYGTSGHSVSSSQPDKLLDDVRTWLLRTDPGDEV